jgi:ATPase subunit of ABC transporter with duplicated ATPase domains
MRDFTGNMLFSSHDYEILDSVANRIIEITPNGIIDQSMNYGEYLHSERVKKMRMEMYGSLEMA